MAIRRRMPPAFGVSVLDLMCCAFGGMIILVVIAAISSVNAGANPALGVVAVTASLRSSDPKTIVAQQPGVIVERRLDTGDVDPNCRLLLAQGVALEPPPCGMQARLIGDVPEASRHPVLLARVERVPPGRYNVAIYMYRADPKAEVIADGRLWHEGSLTPFQPHGRTLPTRSAAASNPAARRHHTGDIVANAEITIHGVAR
jgi:hypothetical protein